MYKWRKPRITWKRILGWLGVKKYQNAACYGIDWGNGQDMIVEMFGYKDANGVFNITDMKVSKTNDKQ